MKDIRPSLLLLLTVWLTSAAPGFAAAPLRVLILSGQNNHAWRETTPKLESILGGCGRFEVTVTEHPEQCSREALAQYDALLSNWNTFGNPAATNWPEATRAALLDFVRGGKGFVVVHAGGSSFYDWPEYQQLVGASWKMNQTSHGAPHQFAVRPVGDHPITRGLRPFLTTDELWVRPGIGSLSRTLALGDDQPLAFTLDFGRGRGFTLLLGHSAAFMNTPGFQALLRRGTEWAATATVTLPAGPATGEADLDAALKALAGYRFGDNRKAVLDLEELVQAVAGDDVARRALADKLARMLGSDATLEARQIACRQLSLIGSGAEVDALAKCLGDQDLDYCARLALERIPGPEADAALLNALNHSTGEARLGIINSLGRRRSPGAVPALAALARDSDAALAGAALDALGQIGGQPAAQALTAVAAALPPALKPRWAGALLDCAQALAAAGQVQPACASFETLTGPDQPPAIRMAALAGLVKTLGEPGTARLLAALDGADDLLQQAAVRALPVTPQPAALVQPVAERLERLRGTAQAQAVVWLADYPGPAVLAALTRAAASPVQATRRAALRALGSAGDASVIRVLAAEAAKGGEDEQRLAVEALVRLPGDDIVPALVAALKTGAPAEKPALIRALELRQAQAAVPVLFEIAGGNDPALRRLALSAVGKLGDLAAGAELTRFLTAAPEDAAAAMAELCRRSGSAEPMLKALAAAPAPAKAALLEALSSLGGAPALAAAQAELKGEDPEVRLAAVRALANWSDAAPLSDLATLAATTTDNRTRALALKGVAHLAPLAKGHPKEAVRILTQAMAAAGSLSEKQALLAAFSEIPSDAAAQAVQTWLNDPALAKEAKSALDQIQDRLKKEPAPPWNDEITALFDSPENLCRGATATNLDNLVPDGQGLGPFAAVDGKPETYWDETDFQPLYWLRVQLKQPATVACLCILGYQHQNYAPKDFEVLADGKLIRKVENATYQRNLLTVELPATECRVVDLKITGYYGQSPAIRELGLFSKTVSAK